MVFSKSDTASFKTEKGRFRIMAYHETQKMIAESVKPDIEICMHAVEKFWGYLPIQNYSFLLYIQDYSDQYETLYEEPNRWNFKVFKNIQAGALEHLNSSLYVLPDLGDKDITPVFNSIDYRGFLKEVVVHEYLHTITPIGLHSRDIGELNYLDPSMSKHLWLYEGITEYFAHMVLLQGNVISLDEYFNKLLKTSVVHAEKYPVNKMSVMEMSENVLQKSYNRKYKYIYTYGHILAIAMDLEILRLSNGSLSLKDVVKQLYEKYGCDQSFNDDEFLDEFLSLVPENIRDFFDNYIIGRKELDLNEYLKTIGVTYFKKDSLYMPTIFTYKSGIGNMEFTNLSLLANGNIKITPTPINNVLKQGDEINIYELDTLLFEDLQPIVEEGDTVLVTINRNGYKFKTPFEVQYQNTEFQNFFIIDKLPDPAIKQNRDIWLGK